MSRAGLNRTTGLATLTLTLAAESPDIDIVAYFRGSVTGFAHHRGFTHTLIGMPVMAGATVALVYGIYRLMKSRGRAPAQAPKWKLLFLYSMLAVLVHIFQDFTNNYGVRPFSPFYPKWYSSDLVFIVDPLMLIALLCGLFLPGLINLVTEEMGEKKPQFRGRGGAITALICLSVLIFVRWIEHGRAVDALTSVTYRNEDPLRVSAYPNPLNLFSWNGVVETRDFFEMLPVNSLSGALGSQNESAVRYKPEETPATLAAKRSRLGRVYLDWAQYPLVETIGRPHEKEFLVQFEDLRFASIARLRRSSSPTLAGYVLLGPDLSILDEYMGQAPPD